MTSGTHMLKNPLRQEPREQRAAVIRSNNEFSLVEWLQLNGRLIARETQESDYLDTEEISELMAVDDITYDISDDEPDVDLED